MTAKEAINILELHNPFLGTDKKLTEAFDMAIKALTAQQWIPCSERLPDEKGYYLTTTMYQEVYCDYWNGECFNRTEMIIAWKSLPEPWKGERA